MVLDGKKSISMFITSCLNIFTSCAYCIWMEQFTDSKCAMISIIRVVISKSDPDRLQTRKTSSNYFKPIF